MRFTIYHESRQGGRANNEDRLSYCYSREALLMVIADGMGGHHYGEVASQIAVQTLADAFRQTAHPRLEDPFHFLQSTLQHAHNAILDYAQRHQLKDAPRTTCVACVIQDDIAYWVHVGDSRLYLMRNGRVFARTRDHSRVRRLLDEGLISEAQAKVHPERNIIYNCLGSPRPPEIEFSRKTPLLQGDILLLCTDGIWGTLPESSLVSGLADHNLMQAAAQLASRAEKAGGPHGDNLSLITVRWEQSYIEDLGSQITTHAMTGEEVTTRLDEFGRNPAYKSDLSDEEIEQAIEEIRAAIEKSTPKK